MSSYFSKKLSYKRALSWIFGSAFVFSFLSYKIINYSFIKKRKVENKRIVSYIIQTGPQKEALLSDYLVELLGVSLDKPSFLASFDTKEAKKKLCSSPVIAEAEVKKIKPNMIYIDYTVRKPVVWIGDFFNAALDREGTVFPMHPFFSPKKMSEVYFGEKGLKDLENLAFGSNIQGHYLDLAFSVLDYLGEKGKDLFFVKKIDVSESLAPSLGKREVVVVIENEIYPASGQSFTSLHFLRLTPKQYAQEITNYLKLREHLLEVEKQETEFSLKDKVIDLRLPQLAFIDPSG